MNPRIHSARAFAADFTRLNIIAPSGSGPWGQSAVRKLLHATDGQPNLRAEAQKKVEYNGQSSRGHDRGFRQVLPGHRWLRLVFPMGRHYKQTRRPRLLKLIRDKIERSGPDLDLNRLTLWHCGRSHPLAALLVDVERLGMRKLVGIVVELDTVQSQADQRMRTWVTRMIHASAAARLDAKDVAALLDRKGIAMRDSFPSIPEAGSFSHWLDVSIKGHYCNRVADDAGPDRWAFLWRIHPMQFPIAYDLICRFATSRKVTNIDAVFAGPGTGRDI